MNREATTLHRQAMEAADKAFLAKLRGDLEVAQEFAAKAFELEKRAAEQLINSQPGAEPSRSVLLRSAAALALAIANYQEARRLVHIALEGNPPAEIAVELGDLKEEIDRHCF
jgi:tetratricopeptide (TPR) repeat protein